MNAKMKKMPEVKWFPLVVMIMSICMLGSKPIQRSIRKSALPENVKCATALTAGNCQMTQIAREHPDLIIKAFTRKLVKF